MNIAPKAPLFRDPIYDGAADPTIIWNKSEEAWWIFYTNRRAIAPNIGVAYVHGTDIGICSSKDGGRTWTYRGIAMGLEFEPGRNTFWAPEIIEHAGIYHMYVSYVRGIPQDWNCGRAIIHYTSNDLWNWKFESVLKLSSDRVIDACVFEFEEGTWRMWYKDEKNKSYTYSATSKDLYHWEVEGPVITDCSHEGPNVFQLENTYWMITDPWCGIGVYKSKDGIHWERQKDILNEPGSRRDDGTIGSHGDVLVHKGRAYLFYFTHPEVSLKERRDPQFVWEYRHRRTSLQVAELKVVQGEITCDRDQVEIDLE